MSLNSKISFLLDTMYEYQMINNITKHCITNVMYLKDNMNYYGYNSKAKAVITIHAENKILVTTIHLVIDCNGRILDPSYEIHSKDAEYYDKLNIALDRLKELSIMKDIEIKYTISQFLHFMKIAEEINNGKCIVSDKEYYHSQADYIDKQILINKK